MNKHYLPAAVALLTGLQPAFGEALDPVVVTATRTAQTVDESLSSVSIITREDIERRQAHSVTDVLRGLPGVSIANNGGRGKATAVFLRGTESDHVLVMIDGVKVGSATLGTTAFEDLPIDEIERIEVVRGPRSSLYGSEAIGGVIQIFTRRGGGAFRPRLSIGAGSHDTVEGAVGVSGGGARGRYSLNISGLDTKGFNACKGSATAGCFTTEPDRDGYRNHAASLDAGYRFDNGLEVAMNALFSAGNNAYDGGFVNESKPEQQVLGASLRYSPLQAWRMTLTAGRSRDDSDNFKDGEFRSRFKTLRDTLSWQNDVSIGAQGLLTLGVDYQNDRVGGTTAYTVDERDDTGLFAIYQSGFGANDVELSLRQDDNAQYGKHATGSFALGHALGNGVRWKLAYGTAFKAPTFNELYFPGFGNPNLDPEESDSLEIALNGKSARGDWSLSAYQTSIDNLIAYDAAVGAPGNVARARIRGLEAEAGVHLAHWDIRASLTLLDPKDRSGGANDGNVLPRRARQSLSLDADRDFGKYRLGATVIAAGKRYDDLANTREMASYATLDLRAEYELAGGWRIQARIENLLDEDYETASFYNQPGRGVYLTLRY